MGMNEIPKDPVMLYSFLNTKLRDFYTSFDDLCEDMDLDKEEILSKLKAMGFVYDEKMNRFR